MKNSSLIALSPGLLVAYPRGPQPQIPAWLICAACFLAGAVTGWLTHLLFTSL